METKTKVGVVVGVVAAGTLAAIGIAVSGKAPVQDPGPANKDTQAFEAGQMPGRERCIDGSYRPVGTCD